MDAPCSNSQKYLQVLHFDPDKPSGVCDVSEVGGAKMMN